MSGPWKGDRGPISLRVNFPWEGGGGTFAGRGESGIGVGKWRPAKRVSEEHHRERKRWAST